MVWLSIIQIVKISPFWDFVSQNPWSTHSWHIWVFGPYLTEVLISEPAPGCDGGLERGLPLGLSGLSF
jgi:hypothetical protein